MMNANHSPGDMTIISTILRYCRIKPQESRETINVTQVSVVWPIETSVECEIITRDVVKRVGTGLVITYRMTVAPSNRFLRWNWILIWSLLAFFPVFDGALMPWLENELMIVTDNDRDNCPRQRIMNVWLPLWCLWPGNLSQFLLHKHSGSDNRCDIIHLVAGLSRSEYKSHRTAPRQDVLTHSLALNCHQHPGHYNKLHNIIADCRHHRLLVVSVFVGCNYNGNILNLESSSQHGTEGNEE